MYKLLIASTFLFFALGCQTVREIQGPDGTPHLLVTCSSIHACYRDARKGCNSNYKIINTSTSVDSGIDTFTSSRQNLLVKCEGKPEDLNSKND